jgi:hypothetical protein
MTNKDKLLKNKDDALIEASENIKAHIKKHLKDDIFLIEEYRFNKIMFNESDRSKKTIAVLEKIILEKYNIDVTKQDTWNDSEVKIREGLTVKLSATSCNFELVENNFNLEKDLNESAEIKERVKDDRFANELYAALCNVDWYKDDISWACSWRYSGGLVADLRDRGEDYLDFYCNGGEGAVSEEVAEALAKLGWTKYKEL